MSTQGKGAIGAEFDAIEEEFAMFADWSERYEHLIALGRAAPGLEEALKTPQNIVRGCASQVWLIADRDPHAPQILRLKADSDALIVRGLIALLLRLFNGRKAADVLAFDADAAFKKIGLTGALTAQRSNGLAAMIGRIRAEAQALLAAQP